MKKLIILIGVVLVMCLLVSASCAPPKPAPAPAPPPPEIVTPPPPAPAPAAFSVSNLSIQPAEVQPKELVTISVSVANTGGTEGSYSVVLKINGVKEAEKSIPIAAGHWRVVSFTVAKEDAGSYSVTVDGLSGSFTIVAPPAPPPIVPPAPPAKPPVRWPLVGGIIGGVVIVGLLIFFLVVRRILSLPLPFQRRGLRG